jgi:DNA repair protein RecO (recombination protein O)
VAARKASAAPLAAFVLHRWDWSETSLIVEMFTRERGRLVVAAKGAKRPYSQLRPVLLPFQRLQLHLGRAPRDADAEVRLLRGAERVAGPAMPAGGALFAGFYLNELLLKLLAREDPHEALFDAYADTVAALQGADDAAVQPSLRGFELLLLRELGLLPELDRETATQQPLQAARRYTLDAQAGLIPADARADAAGLSGAALAPLEAALARRDAPALRAAARPVLDALRPVLRQLLHYHLGVSRLRTRQVLLDVQKLLNP